MVTWKVALRRAGIRTVWFVNWSELSVGVTPCTMKWTAPCWKSIKLFPPQYSATSIIRTSFIRNLDYPD